ncbi:hypothetical protein GCM10022254_05000 [Actinomadura meridiana]|uniref:Tetratricopeptide repeat protein n=1 Tax=Actinomadura meridiana TaxID=559626 RepID=A0ABP8BSG3_9ACTN
MRANFEDSYAGLPAAAARMFRLLSVPPGDDIDPATAAALADVPEPEARDLLETLAARGLAAGSGQGRFGLPGRVRAFARERADREESETDRDDALRRVLDHHLAGAGAPGTEGVVLLERERWAEAADALEESLHRAEHDDDPHAVLAARHDLARALTRTGDLDRAIDLLGALPDEFAALPDPDDDGRVRALEGLGEAYLRADRPVAAINFFGQALELVRKRGAADEQARMFVHIADAARVRGDRAAEGAALRRAAEIHER